MLKEVDELLIVDVLLLLLQLTPRSQLGNLTDEISELPLPVIELIPILRHLLSFALNLRHLRLDEHLKHVSGWLLNGLWLVARVPVAAFAPIIATLVVVAVSTAVVTFLLVTTLLMLVLLALLLMLLTLGFRFRLFGFRPTLRLLRLRLDRRRPENLRAL